MIPILSSGTTLFITFELKVFPLKESNAQSFNADFFICPHHHHHARHPPQTTGLISVSSGSQLFSSDAKTQITDFFQIPKILRARFQCRTSFTSPGLNFYLGFLFWHLWMTHPTRARVNTCAHIAPN